MTARKATAKAKTKATAKAKAKATTEATAKAKAQNTGVSPLRAVRSGRDDA
jgi:membrane protein involved in colicin uptake